MSRLGNIGGRLYRGEVSIDFVSRQKLWYAISGCILVISLAALLFRGLNYSVDFKGGSAFTVPAATSVNQSSLEQVVFHNGGTNPSATEVKPFNGKAPYWQVQTSQLSTTQSLKIQADIAKQFDINVGNIAITTVGSSWGSQVSQKALEALIAFLVVIVIYLTIAFEWRMAAAAFVALAHDIVITIGVYALTGFQVSPATIIGLLTILGYSLYDTVVVFDKVRENTASILGTRKRTYSEAANLALNQTLVRSINTSLTALLPVAAILVVGTLLLGNGELKDLSLVLFVGMLSGTYSSIFIATPVLADLKEREPQYKQLAKQVALRAAGGRSALRKARTAAPGSVAAVGAQAGNGGSTAIDVAGTGLSGTVSSGSGSSGSGLSGSGLSGSGSSGSGLSGSGSSGTGSSGTGRSGSGSARTGSASSGPSRTGPPGNGLGSPGLGEPDDDLAPDAEFDDDDDEPVAASQPARAASDRPAGARQQPVRRTSARRRPSGKKKRR